MVQVPASLLWLVILMIHEQLPSSHCHQPAPNSLIMLEPAVTIGCAEKKRLEPGREQAGGGSGRGEKLPPDPKMAQREFQTAAGLSPTNSLAAEFQSVTHMLLLPAGLSQRDRSLINLPQAQF